METKTFIVTWEDSDNKQHVAIINIDTVENAHIIANNSGTIWSNYKLEEIDRKSVLTFID